MAGVPDLVAQRVERQRLRQERIGPHRAEEPALRQQEVGAFERHALLDLAQQRGAEPSEVPLVQQLVAQLRERPPLAEGAAVLQALERRREGLPRRHQERRDPQAGGEGEEVARQRQLRRHAAVDQRVDQREAEEAEQQGERRGHRAAHDELDVPQLVAQDGVGEGERHDGERHDRRRGQQLRRAQAGDPRQAVERQERQVAAGEPHRHPVRLPLLVPAPVGAQAGDEHGDGGEGVDRELGEHEPVEREDRGRRRSPEEEPAAAQAVVELERQESGGREVEEGEHAAAPPRRRQPRRQLEEEVEGQRRQQDQRAGIHRVEQPVDGVDRRRRGDEIGGRREQRPEVEEEALPLAALPHQRVEADQQVDGADQRHHQIRDVEVERRAARKGLRGAARRAGRGGWSPGSRAGAGGGRPRRRRRRRRRGGPRPPARAPGRPAPRPSTRRPAPAGTPAKPSGWKLSTLRSKLPAASRTAASASASASAKRKVRTRVI